MSEWECRTHEKEPKLNCSIKHEWIQRAQRAGRNMFQKRRERTLTRSTAVNLLEARPSVSVSMVASIRDGYSSDRDDG